MKFIILLSGKKAFTTIAVCWVIWLASAMPLQAADARLSVLALGRPKRFSINEKVAAYLKRNRIEIVVKPFTEPFSQQMLSQFHFVLMTQFGGLQAPWFALNDHLKGYFVMKQNIAEIHRYVEAGGGLLFIPNLGEAGGAAATQAFAPLLEPWGIEVLAANARDDARAWTTYAWTTNVAKSPVTKGVKRLYYPTQMGRWDDLYPTPPIQLHHKRWQPVVRGMPGSVTALCLRYTKWFPLAGAQDPPILAAVATIGKGRVALLAINPIYLLSDPYRDKSKTWFGEFNTGVINGTVIEKGDGEHPSDGRQLLLNMFKWVGQAGVKAGLGGFTPESYEKLLKPDKPKVPAWLLGWNASSGARLYKVLIGARSKYSDGAGAIADYAAAARQAGYSILVMTETFEHFDRANWAQFREDCRAASTDELVVIAGLDLADEYGARYLLFGQSAFPQKFMLMPDGKAIKQTPYMMLGLTPSTSVLARPGSSPLPQEIYKFFSAIAVYTYRDGKLVDNGIPAYQWHIHNRGDPFPLAVHEVYSPEGVAAAGKGHQLFIPADTPRNAAWYLRHGHQHYWEVPSRFLVTSGPIIRELTSTTFTVQNNVPNLVDPKFVVEADVPITDIRYYVNHNLLRRWTPNATKFTGQVALTHSQRTWGFLMITDAKGRTCISPPLKGGKGHGYDWRCSDHQNWFGGAINYTGTRLPGGVNIVVPAFGTDEAKGFWPYGGGPRRGENMAPLISFPYNSPAVTITDATIDQRYWKALWEEVAYDAKPSQGLVRSRIYQGRVRYHDFHYESFYAFTRRQTRPLMLIDISLRLRRPVIPTGEVFPVIARAGHNPVCMIPGTGGPPAGAKLTQGILDLPVGACVGSIIVLTPGLRVDARGNLGFAPPKWNNGALPVDTAWRAGYVAIDPKKHSLDEMRRVMGVAGNTPYALQLARGTLEGFAYVARLKAKNFGVAGTVKPYAKMPYALPLRIEGINWNWPAAVWQPGLKTSIVAFGVFEQNGWARLDVTHGGPFYAGNVVLADDPRLRISLMKWDAKTIAIEVNNPTDAKLTTVVRTPSEITDRFALRETIEVPAGTSLRLRFPGKD